jgi:hypothetical protein
MKFLLCVAFLFFVVEAIQQQQCKNIKFYFKNQKLICHSSSMEKEIFTKLKISLKDGHDEVLDFWMRNYEFLKGKKYTILHIDSRLMISSF